MTNFQEISGLSILLPILYGIFVYRYLTRELCFLFWLCCIGLMFEGNNYFIQYQLPSNLTFLSNYTWYGVEFIVLMIVFSTWSNNKIYFRIGLLFLILHTFISLMNGFSQFDPTTRIISSIIISFSSIFLFRKSLFQEDRVMSVIFAGLFFYFSMNIVVFLLLSSLELEIRRQFWNFHTVMNILMNISFVVGFYMRKRFVKSSINSNNISSGYQPHSTSIN